MSKLGVFFKNAANASTPLAILALLVFLVYERLHPVEPVGPSFTVNGKALGQAYGPVVTTTLADGWLAAANALEQGKSVTEAQTALQSTWQAERVAAFTAKVAPDFARVLPEGTEPTDPTQRAAVVKLWRDFAAGLKGGR